MAQRDRRPPPRIGAGLLTFGTRLPGGFPQPEKARPRPMRAGDPPRDLGQGAVALAVILKAIIEYDDPMRAPAPLAKQSCAGFEQQSRREGAGSIRLQFFGHPAQPALYGGSEPAMGSLLQLVAISRIKRSRLDGAIGSPHRKARQAARSCRADIAGKAATLLLRSSISGLRGDPMPGQAALVFGSDQLLAV